MVLTARYSINVALSLIAISDVFVPFRAEIASAGKTLHRKLEESLEINPHEHVEPN